MNTKQTKFEPKNSKLHLAFNDNWPSIHLALDVTWLLFTLGVHSTWFSFAWRSFHLDLGRLDLGRLDLGCLVLIRSTDRAVLLPIPSPLPPLTSGPLL